MKNLFPVIMVALSIGAAVMYARERDWGHVLYWVSASAITTSTIIMGG